MQAPGGDRQLFTEDGWPRPGILPPWTTRSPCPAPIEEAPPPAVPAGPTRRNRPSDDSGGHAAVVGIPNDDGNETVVAAGGRWNPG
ncbi:hypothetical protein QJS66_17635 [Kocuria rhizophila]|nr:hypothetical protein QJS66_17635 [Kocuria rhizophila]